MAKTSAESPRMTARLYRSAVDWQWQAEGGQGRYNDAYQCHGGQVRRGQRADTLSHHNSDSCSLWLVCWQAPKQIRWRLTLHASENQAINPVCQLTADIVRVTNFCIVIVLYYIAMYCHKVVLADFERFRKVKTKLLREMAKSPHGACL